MKSKRSYSEHRCASPLKHLGQHFLESTAYAKRIADSVPLRNGEQVLEIGPGLGALSVHLLKRAPGLHLVEIDSGVLERLKTKLGDGKYTLHNEDILSFDFSKAGFPLHVVGNLPYFIAAPIIKKTLFYGNHILTFTFMVQREVAQRIVSGAHTKTNGFLTILCQFFGTAEILMHVPPGAFYPPPKVDSSVVRLTIRRELDTLLPPERWNPFLLFVSKGFSQRRKQLTKVLGEGIRKDVYAALLSTSGISPLSRAEDLDITEWLRVYRSAEEVA